MSRPGSEPPSQDTASYHQQPHEQSVSSWAFRRLIAGNGLLAAPRLPTAAVPLPYSHPRLSYRGRAATVPPRSGGTIGGPTTHPSLPPRPPPLQMLERGPGGEASPHSVLSVANNPSLRPLSFPHPPPICTIDGDWQLQVLPGAPGTARQGPTRTIMLVNSGGNATQPRAPGHDRPPAAQRAAGHGRLSAATRAPGADVPLATTAGAPGQYCLSAALRAPGHGRPLAAQRAAGHDRLSAELPAPGADVPPAIAAGAPGQHRLSAAPIATAPVPAGLRRLRQGILPRVPANPRTLIYPHSHRDTALTRTAFPHTPRYAQSRESRNPPLSTMWRGAGGEGRHLFPLSSGKPLSTHQVHPAVQVPPRPRSCSTAHTGLLLRPPSRAPPKPTRRKPLLASRFPLSTWWRGPG